MPPRSNPSERQRRLGLELRKLRNGAGLSGDRAGALLDADRTRISNIEAGRIDVSRNRLYKLLREYGCPHGPYFDGLMEMAQELGKGWWDDFKDAIGPRARDLAELESRCSGIRIHEPLFIPGMFQTEDYARAVVTTAEQDQDQERVDRYVKFRMARQRVLTDPDAVPYHAIVHEAALRLHVGGTGTLRKQLLRLIEIARLPNVTLQIFPFERGAYAAFSRPFILFSGATRELDTVYIEHPLKSVFLGDGDANDKYGKMFERLAELALEPVDPESAPESHDSRDSLSLIQHIMYEL
ncbi:helix-turn-helix transcriptional regulator [Streptomyces sp. ISL-100]|uniref:helix-turn-helix domain-containing protein n=1 Tax=Streptomyces sp. ISL-100 TaxID=2819173 RepID=UPI001BEB04DA|nr:helix-turn-helix transcriptional regulator [Streptomyces sp. ISL-100]MBT2395471.1 helix-turn-helix domain-containing protein [Streptomyces sp. ISL-100]